MTIFTIIIIILFIFIMCFSVIGANRAFSTPEEKKYEDDEQWRIINGR